MAEITLILAVNIRGQFFIVITTAASTRCLVENFQLICYLQRINAKSQYEGCGSSSCSKWPNDRTGCSGEALLAPCTGMRRLQKKMTKGYHWIGVEENIGMLGKS